MSAQRLNNRGMSLSPEPLAAAFGKQAPKKLKLDDHEITILEAAIRERSYVDAANKLGMDYTDYCAALTRLKRTFNACTKARLITWATGIATGEHITFSDIEPKTANLHLSAREKEILEHLIQGKLYKQIAYELGSTADTVKAQMRILLRKTGCNNRAEAQEWWQKNKGKKVYSPMRSNQKVQLTPRETVMLKLLQTGLSNKGIANVLRISDMTVKATFRTLFKQIKCTNRHEAAEWAKTNLDSVENPEVQATQSRPTSQPRKLAA